MREAYAERRLALTRALDDRLTPSGDAAGLDLVAWLPPSADERAVLQAAAERDLAVEGIGGYRLRRAAPPGLLLGFAACTPRVIADGASRLAMALRDSGVRA